jgi:hypothetical protein
VAQKPQAHERAHVAQAVNVTSQVDAQGHGCQSGRRPPLGRMQIVPIR